MYGTILLLVSWLFFNGGNTQDMFRHRANDSAKICMNTLLSAFTSGLSATFLKPVVMGTYSENHRYDTGALTNGLLAGLVAITGSCDRCEPWSSFLIGLLAGLIYTFACKLVVKIGVDDPVEASMVHGACGIWGVIAVGIFDNKHGLISKSEDSWSFLGW